MSSTDGSRFPAATQSVKQSAVDALSDHTDTAHSRDDALSAREFERLVDATYRMKSPQALEARAVLFICGRLGLRSGEAAHLSASWVNWSDNTLSIPEYDPCTSGTNDGEVCGYCRRRAVDEVRARNLSIDDAVAALRQESPERAAEMSDGELRDAAQDLRSDINRTVAEACADRWQPKTPHAARTTPFDFDARIPLVLESFFERFDGWEKSKATLNRRVNRVAEVADVDANVYPHALRATAASAHAARDVSAYSLMNTMGWSDIATARAYVASNDEQAAREIRSKHR
jgi:hypothetical protein